MTKLSNIPTIAKATSQFLEGKEPTLCPQALRILGADWENGDFAALCTVLCGMCEGRCFPYRWNCDCSVSLSFLILYSLNEWGDESVLELRGIILRETLWPPNMHSDTWDTWILTQTSYVCTHTHSLLILLKYKRKKKEVIQNHAEILTSNAP